jgi:hypothetical protein
MVYIFLIVYYHPASGFCFDFLYCKPNNVKKKGLNPQINKRLCHVARISKKY